VEQYLQLQGAPGGPPGSHTTSHHLGLTVAEGRVSRVMECVWDRWEPAVEPTAGDGRGALPTTHSLDYRGAEVAVG